MMLLKALYFYKSNLFIFYRLYLIINFDQKMKIASSYFSKEFDLDKAEMVGQGNFAQVYRIYDQQTNQFLAIRKVFKSQAQRDDISKQIAINEELMRVQNQNILRIYDIIDSKEFVWYITEYCEGGSLWDTLNTLDDNKMNEKDALQCILQVSKGVQQLHNHRITHRDLKPENILLKNKYVPGRPVPTIKLADFGLSTKKIIMETIAGTKQYIAPEQAKFQNYTNAVDVWSLGIICDQILHGTPFYSGQNNKQVFSKILKLPFKIRDQSIRASIQAFLISVLKKKPYQRPIIAVIRQNLEDIIQEINNEKLKATNLNKIKKPESDLTKSMNKNNKFQEVDLSDYYVREKQNQITTQQAKKNKNHHKQQTNSNSSSNTNIVRSDNIAQKILDHKKKINHIRTENQRNYSKEKQFDMKYRPIKVDSNYTPKKQLVSDAKSDKVIEQFHKLKSLHSLDNNQIIGDNKRPMQNLQNSPRLRKEDLNEMIQNRHERLLSPYKNPYFVRQQSQKKYRLSRNKSNSKYSQLENNIEIKYQKKKQVNNKPNNKKQFYKAQIFDLDDYTRKIYSMKQNKIQQCHITMHKDKSFIPNAYLNAVNITDQSILKPQESFMQFKKKFAFLNYISPNADYDIKLARGSNALQKQKQKCLQEYQQYQQAIKKNFMEQMDTFIENYLDKCLR